MVTDRFEDIQRRLGEEWPSTFRTESESVQSFRMDYPDGREGIVLTIKHESRGYRLDGHYRTQDGEVRDRISLGSRPASEVEQEAIVWLSEALSVFLRTLGEEIHRFRERMNRLAAELHFNLTDPELIRASEEVDRLHIYHERVRRISHLVN